MIIKLINRKSESIRCTVCGITHIIDIHTASTLRKHNIPYICDFCEEALTAEVGSTVTEEL